MHLVLIGLGGFAGAVARYLVDGWASTLTRGAFPWGTTRLLRLSKDLPILIELVDTEERIRAALPVLDEMVGDGLITLEKVEVIAYRAGDTERDEPG